ncbi:MAG TPA: aldo/keto reductase, partial [Methanoregula sp.]|nr:aldo/keto reductase [Methanoregula sp.]
MQVRKVPKTGDELSVLGFGFMRLPSKKQGSGIDEERAIRQLRYAIDHGVNYVDTAPAYHFGRSEQILARALEDGYRKKVRIATKLPPWSVRTRGDMDRILDGQLATLKTSHIDYYLLHSLTKESFSRLKSLGVLEFLTAARQDGRIKNAGFSSHADLATFREIVDSYDWTFCQIQYNYLDEYNQAGTEGLEYAHGRDLAVMVMEPLRGGNLAGPVPDDVQRIWDQAPVRRPPAEWALRWVWDHPGVTVVLSGMNDERHIDENLRAAEGAYPRSLSLDDLSRIASVRDTYQKLMKIGCTGCRYCLPCPAGVDIPGCFSLYNARFLFPHDNSAKFQYFGRHGGLMGGVSYAGLCRACGRCEKACPQHLRIRDLLQDVSREMESGMHFIIPVLKAGLWCMDQAAKV